MYWVDSDLWPSFATELDGVDELMVDDWDYGEEKSGSNAGKSDWNS